MIAKLLPYPSNGTNRRQAVIGEMAIKCDWVDTGKYDETREAVKKAITLVMFKSALAPSAANIKIVICLVDIGFMLFLIMVTS